jgi:cytidine deaminase
MKLDEKLVQACKDFINERFPDHDEIEGAAAMYTEDGEILLSTAPEVFNSFAGLCHEAGAFCEAYKRNKKITASVCISREKDGSFIIFTPCGICQERLYHYGGSVEVAVAKEKNTSHWEAKQLQEVQPYYWAKPFIK